METVIIVIHLMVVVALIAVVLLQRSEGGALGIGGGNAFMSARGQGNVFTKATAILAVAFFVTSLGLTMLTRLQAPPSSILDNVPANVPAPAADGTTPPATGQGGGGILDELNAFTGQEAPGTSVTPPPAEPAPDAATDQPAAAPQVPTSQ